MEPTPFDYTLADAQAMPAAPVEVEKFDLERYADYAAECDQRFAAFMRKPSGVAVWQRVRIAEVFRDGCRDMHQSLRWQLGGLKKSLLYKSDAPTYLEPWYGIGTTASAFGAEYEWPAGQAPVVRPLFATITDMPDLEPRPWDQVPILQHTIAMIEYFLESTQGRLPISWCDVQAPLNVAAELIDTTGFYMAFYEDPERLRRLLDTIADAMIAFTRQQSRLIGSALVRPGHGFASSYSGMGIGMSNDDLVMISPKMYTEICVPSHDKVGQAFEGAAVHSCGDWGRWIKAVQQIPSLSMIDGAFSPQTDPAYNSCEQFRDAFAGTGVVLHARLVGSPEQVLAHVQRLWRPDLKLVITTYEQDPQRQRQLYEDIHAICS